jgi:hypothetical protein
MFLLNLAPFHGEAPTYCGEKSEKKRVARIWIVVGFALVALGAIANFIDLASNNYFAEGNVRAALQVFAFPIGSFAALCAWWFLSKLATVESNHPSIFRKAFLWLTAESLCLCGTYVNLLWVAPGLDQYGAPCSLEAFGSAGSAIGCFLMSREFSPQKAMGEPAGLR